MQKQSQVKKQQQKLTGVHIYEKNIWEHFSSTNLWCLLKLEVSVSSFSYILIRTKWYEYCVPKWNIELSPWFNLCCSITMVDSILAGTHVMCFCFLPSPYIPLVLPTECEVMQKWTAPSFSNQWCNFIGFCLQGSPLLPHPLNSAGIRGLKALENEGRRLLT